MAGESCTRDRCPRCRRRETRTRGTGGESRGDCTRGGRCEAGSARRPMSDATIRPLRTVNANREPQPVNREPISLCYTAAWRGNLEIPNRSLFRQPEVCEIAQVQPYVLRSWEAEFQDLGVAKTAGRSARLPPGGRRAGAADQAPAVRRGTDAGRRAPEAAGRAAGAAARRPDGARRPARRATRGERILSVRAVAAGAVGDAGAGSGRRRHGVRAGRADGGAAKASKRVEPPRGRAEDARRNNKKK